MTDPIVSQKSHSSFHAHITKTVVDRLRPGDTVWDDEVKGFGARRQIRCVSYFIKTRLHGRQKWISIGRHGELSPTGVPWTPFNARKQALAFKADPSVVAKNKSACLTLMEASEVFEKDHIAKLKTRTRSDYKKLLDQKIIPRLGHMNVIDVARCDVVGFHNALRHTPRRANYTLAILSKFMSWCELSGYRPQNSNPCVGIKKFPESKRQRYLSATELTRLGASITDCMQRGDISPYAAGAIRLLIFTGARLSEILTLEWAWINYERKQIWLPDSKTGQKPIKLNDPALAVLRSLPRIQENPHVIVGGKAGTHLVNLQKPWSFVRDSAKLDDVRLHDLRHSFASVAASSGASLPMIGKLLGHTQAQTTARYAHLADQPLQDLNEEIGQALSTAMNKSIED